MELMMPGSDVVGDFSGSLQVRGALKPAKKYAIAHVNTFIHYKITPIAMSCSYSRQERERLGIDYLESNTEGVELLAPDVGSFGACKMSRCHSGHQGGI
jgi:hypothetical protein